MFPWEKCRNPNCLRSVAEGWTYCCTDCSTAAVPRTPFEVEHYGTFDGRHSEECAARLAARGFYAPDGATAAASGGT